MGRGVIVSHLGDGHYRVGLDIDVSYARNQLVAIQTYLDEFAPAYQEATEKKDTARQETAARVRHELQAHRDEARGVLVQVHQQRQLFLERPHFFASRRSSAARSASSVLLLRIPAVPPWR